MTQAYDYLRARTMQAEIGAESFLGTTILLPGDADTYMRETDAQMRSVAVTVEAERGKLPADFLTSWDAFLNDWNKFFQEHLGDINIIDGGRALMGETDVYVQRLLGYQQKMSALKVAVNVPGVTIDPSSTAVPNRPLSTTEKIAIGAGATVAIVVLFKTLL